MSDNGTRRKDRFKTADQSSNTSEFNLQSESLVQDSKYTEELEELLLRETVTGAEYNKLKGKSSTCYEYLKNCKDTDHCMFSPFPDNDNGIPINWTSVPSSVPSPCLVTLQPDEKEYQCIRQELESAGIEITKIERLENFYLLNRFKSEIDDLKKHRNKDFDLNIQYLYHGTTVEKQRISEEGLDQRLSRMGFFGKGIYFSDNPLKCIHYAKDKHGIEESYILKCRVILGESKVFPKGEYDTSLKREPEKPNLTTGWRFYDSVVGCPKDYNEFVVYENRRAMIEYIISFQLDQKGRQELQERVPSPLSFVDVECTSNDTHTDKIQEIRETIRRKRCVERGEVYKPPDEERRRRDREIWLRLQQLHKGQQSSQDASYEVGVSRQQDGEVSSTELTDQIDPVVEEVMDSLVTDFLVVTATENIEAAKYYIERSQMDVDKAITMYFEEML